MYDPAHARSHTVQPIGGNFKPELTLKTCLVINIAEYLNTNYKDGQFVNIVKNHESTQPNMKSVLKLATKIIQELSRPQVKSDGTIHKGKIGRSFKRKMEKQGNAWAVHKTYR